MGDTWEKKSVLSDSGRDAVPSLAYRAKIMLNCRNQEHRWRPRVFSLWSDRDDRMPETSNSLSRPDRLEIFWNDWDDHMETRL